MGGGAVPVSDLPRLRAVEVWQGALDLDNGARIVDLPMMLRPHK
jgi:hypothetical protein